MDFKKPSKLSHNFSTALFYDLSLQTPVMFSLPSLYPHIPGTGHLFHIDTHHHITLPLSFFIINKEAFLFYLGRQYPHWPLCFHSHSICRDRIEKQVHRNELSVWFKHCPSRFIRSFRTKDGLATCVDHRKVQHRFTLASATQKK